MNDARDFWTELHPEGEHEPGDEQSYESVIGGPEDFRAVWEELGEFGDRVDLAEYTGRWMRLADHAARLRASCLEQGLGEGLTQRLVEGYLSVVAPGRKLDDDRQ